jgi:hypothetical protein
MEDSADACRELRRRLSIPRLISAEEDAGAEEPMTGPSPLTPPLTPDSLGWDRGARSSSMSTTVGLHESALALNAEMDSPSVDVWVVPGEQESEQGRAVGLSTPPDPNELHSEEDRRAAAALVTLSRALSSPYTVSGCAPCSPSCRAIGGGSASVCSALTTQLAAHDALDANSRGPAPAAAATSADSLAHATRSDRTRRGRRASLPVVPPTITPSRTLAPRSASSPMPRIQCHACPLPLEPEAVDDQDAWRQPSGRIFWRDRP